MSDVSGDMTTDTMMQLADITEIPRPIMVFLLEERFAATLQDIRLLDKDDVTEIHTYYRERYDGDEEKLKLWSLQITKRILYFKDWVNSYHKTYGTSPNPTEITTSNYQTLPEELAQSMELQEKFITIRDSMSPGQKLNFDSNRRSSFATISSTSPSNSRRNVKVSISEYPKFSGQAKDWITFERKFRSVASSQGLDHVMQVEEVIPLTDIEEKNYQSDCAFIYDAFQNCWADSMNFYLVEKNKRKKDGRQVYLDAKNYFRGTAVKDAILTENMDQLVNYKLTHNTPNGAEGFNNKFNDIVNSLEQQGHVLDPKIIKGIYLGNVLDKVYENIKDQAAANETTKLADVQAQILRKYLSVQGERRGGAPSYNHKRFVQNLNSDRHVEFDLEPEIYEYNVEDYAFVGEDGRTVYAAMRRTPKHNPNHLSSFPLIPKDKYDALDEDVKTIMREQHAYFRTKINNLQKQAAPTKNPSNNRSMNLTQLQPGEEQPVQENTADHMNDKEELITDTATSIPTNHDPVLTTFQQFLSRSRKMNVCHITKFAQVTPRAILAKFNSNKGYGRLICDNAADTGSLTPDHCHIIHKSHEQVLVNGCHPTLTKSYHLGSGVTTIDLPSGTILIGQHEVPIIPDSDIMLVSETQARCAGLGIDSKSRHFGGRGSILAQDGTSIPLRLENALMTCPIRKPTMDELTNLPVIWLTLSAPWEPSNVTEPLDNQLIVPLGYSNTLGSLDLTEIDMDLADL